MKPLLRPPMVIVVLILAGLFSLTWAHSAGQPSETEMVSDNSEGHRIYDDHCAICHGADGSGDGKEAERFKTPPADLTSGLYKFRSTPSGAPPLPEDIYRTVTEGLRGTGMLPQLHLSNDQRWAVTRYLFTLLPPDFQDKTPEQVLVPAAPAVMTEQIGQGRALYADLGCASCHGDDGRGNIPAAGELRDYKDRPIVPTDLTLTPRKQSNSPEDLYRILVTGINGTPMPAYADILPPEQMWTLVSYVDGLAVNPMPTADIRGMGMMGMGRMGMMGMMPRMMGFVGEESIGMMIDMPAARAWRMGRRR